MPADYIVRVKNYRWDRGMSQELLAKTLGLSRRGLGMIENGQCEPSLGVAIRIAKYFGTTVERLFTPR